MAKAYGRAKSGAWWLLGLVCAFCFQAVAAFAQQGQAAYGVRRDPEDRALKKKPSPRPPRTWTPPSDPNARADAERLLKRLMEPVKAVEPTAKELDEIKALAESLRKSAGESEAAAKAGRTEDAQRSNQARLEAFQGLARLGPSALEFLREQAEAQAKDATASDFVRSQIPLAIRRIEADVRSALEPKIVRLGRAALDALPRHEKPAAEDEVAARSHVDGLQRRLDGAPDGERAEILRDLNAARETLDQASARVQALRDLRARIVAYVAANPPTPAPYLPPEDPRGPVALYGPRAR